MNARTPQKALIVSHGAPSAPDGPERVMNTLAGAVGGHLPGWQIAGATLAAPGALGAAIGVLGQGPLFVYPLFMSDGWFSTTELPRRLTCAGADDALVLPAFGLDPAVHRLCLNRACAAAAAHPPGSVTLVLAAHGSPTDPRPAAATRAAAVVLEASGVFREVRYGFVDEAPYLADVARVEAPAVCLPFFAGRAGHVETDLPEAMASAEFPGPMLEPIGVDAEVPAIIAAALSLASRQYVSSAQPSEARNGK